MEEEDELAPVGRAAAVNTAIHTGVEDVAGANKVSFWDRDPFYISSTKWADMEEDDY